MCFPGRQATECSALIGGGMKLYTYISIIVDSYIFHQAGMKLSLLLSTFIIFKLWQGNGKYAKASFRWTSNLQIQLIIEAGEPYKNTENLFCPTDEQKNSTLWMGRHITVTTKGITNHSLEMLHWSYQLASNLVILIVKSIIDW